MGFRRDTAALARSPGGKIGAGGLIISRDDRGRPVTAEAVAHLLIAQAFPQRAAVVSRGFRRLRPHVAYREGNGRQLACFGLHFREREPLVPLDAPGEHELGRLRRRRGAQLVQATPPR